MDGGLNTSLEDDVDVNLREYAYFTPSEDDDDEM